MAETEGKIVRMRSFIERVDKDWLNSYKARTLKELFEKANEEHALDFYALFSKKEWEWKNSYIEPENARNATLTMILWEIVKNKNPDVPIERIEHKFRKHYVSLDFWQKNNHNVLRSVLDHDYYQGFRRLSRAMHMIKIHSLVLRAIKNMKQKVSENPWIMKKVTETKYDPYWMEERTTTKWVRTNRRSMVELGYSTWGNKYEIAMAIKGEDHLSKTLDEDADHFQGDEIRTKESAHYEKLWLLAFPEFFKQKVKSKAYLAGVQSVARILQKGRHRTLPGPDSRKSEFKVLIDIDLPSRTGPKTSASRLIESGSAVKAVLSRKKIKSVCKYANHDLRDKYEKHNCYKVHKKDIMKQAGTRRLDIKYTPKVVYHDGAFTEFRHNRSNLAAYLKRMTVFREGFYSFKMDKSNNGYHYCIYVDVHYYTHLVTSKSYSVFGQKNIVHMSTVLNEFGKEKTILNYDGTVNEYSYTVEQEELWLSKSFFLSSNYLLRSKFLNSQRFRLFSYGNTL